MSFIKPLIIGFTLTAMAQPALAHDYEFGSLKIDHPWARATPPGAPVAGGYLTITNTGTEPDRLLGGSSDGAEAVQVHESTVVDGVARMRHVAEGVVIAPGETLKLEPGALHLMFINPKEPLKKGDSFAATITFEAAGDVALEFSVVPMGATPAATDAHQGRGKTPE
ncbi:copper chaperone PCu(A)C [Martelella mediterranea]|uniref:Copper(I)-binding protein n=2 Tax=Martelella mediterranea TaxID=293089 RepID=A0A4R3NN40_9HYPH|nr:copper chaperone PCu(A)C [Martelella mediterranea]AQZ54272.1 hypothetical protein Mame_04980 [Martelella mediterranea DSM 17316]TCT36028.1 hypothetical protein EDC90_102412 [Martelella mediterranea]